METKNKVVEPEYDCAAYHFGMLGLTFLVACVCVVGVAGAICHADKIDAFFTGLLKAL